MKRILICVAAISLARLSMAQTDEKPAEPTGKFYRFDFVLRETEAGKTVNTRMYSMNISTTSPFQTGSVRTGEKVPVPNGKDGQWTFVDVGVNIDCHLHKWVDNQLAIQVVADISSVVSREPPLLNQTKWNAGAIIPIRKSTVLFTADGASTKRQMQLEVTATPVP